MERASSFIKRKAAATLLHSARTARALGRPLNTFVTVNLWQFDVDIRRASALFRELRDQRFQRWSRYTPRGALTDRNGPPTDAWVLEAPNARVHVHWAVHITPENRVEFETKLVKWVLSLAGVEHVPNGAIEVKDIENAEGLKLYMAKGLDVPLAQLWQIRTEDTGTIYGRRAGTSRNLGPAEWRPRKEAWRRAQQAAA